jgi:hypothetical protein
MLGNHAGPRPTTPDLPFLNRTLLHRRKAQNLPPLGFAIAQRFYVLANAPTQQQQNTQFENLQIEQPNPIWPLQFTIGISKDHPADRNMFLTAESSTPPNGLRCRPTEAELMAARAKPR